MNFPKADEKLFLLNATEMAYQKGELEYHLDQVDQSVREIRHHFKRALEICELLKFQDESRHEL